MYNSFSGVKGSDSVRTTAQTLRPARRFRVSQGYRSSCSLASHILSSACAEENMGRCSLLLCSGKLPHSAGILLNPVYLSRKIYIVRHIVYDCFAALPCLLVPACAA